MHCRVRASLLSHDSKHKHALRTKDMTTTPWRRLLVHSCCLQAHDIIDEQGLVCCMASRMLTFDPALGSRQAL